MKKVMLVSAIAVVGIVTLLVYAFVFSGGTSEEQIAQEYDEVFTATNCNDDEIARLEDIGSSTASNANSIAASIRQIECYIEFEDTTKAIEIGKAALEKDNEGVPEGEIEYLTRLVDVLENPEPIPEDSEEVGNEL